MSATSGTLGAVTRSVAKPIVVRSPSPVAPTLAVAPRPGFRILQTSRAPAQLSLFLRPATGTR